MKLLGNYHLASKKAQKLLGEEMSVSQRKAQVEAEAASLKKGIPVSEALEQIIELRMYSLAELKERNVKTTSKILSIMGEECIVSKKAAKLVGPPLNSNEVMILFKPLLRIILENCFIYIKSHLL